jgi:hypothetical protein
MKIAIYLVMISILTITLILFFGFGASSGADLSEEIFHKENYKAVIYKNGDVQKEFAVEKDKIPKEFFENWKNSLKEIGEKDLRSYAPNVLLNNSRIRVNFGKKTVISYKEDALQKSVWLQYSRNPTKEDKKMAEWLRIGVRSGVSP